MPRLVLSPHSSQLRSILPPGIQRVGPLAEVPELLLGFGIAPSAVLARVGLAADALAEREGQIPYALAGALLRECALASGCDHFGLTAGARWCLDHLGLPGQMAGSCRNVGRALETFTTFHWMNSSGGVVFLSRDGGFTNLGYAIFEPRMTNGVDQIYDLVVAIGVRMLRELSGISTWAPTEVLLSRRRPKDELPYRRFFRAPVRFDAESSLIRFPTAMEGTSVSGADDAQYRALETRLRELGRESTGISLHRLIRVAMIFGRTSGDSVAAAMGLSRRTFKRRMAESGTTFQRELNAVRQTVAQQLMRETNLPVTEIAAALGYAERAPFIRAFRRWTGTSPGNWRLEASRAP
jgi:AraC-like DNA-binding protein